MELRFSTESSHGLLLLAHKSHTVDGNYLALALRGGRVEASYNLGKESPSRPLVLASNVSVSDGLTHSVVFYR